MEFYAQIKGFHVAMAMASIGVFALRGAGVLAGMRWPQWLPLRLLSYTIDTALLTAALMLLTILPGAVFANGWLAAKLALIVVYIVFGTFALKRGRTRKAKALCYAAALLTFWMAYAIARSHQPWGFVHAWLG